jgi:hypothetical protein
MGNTRRTFVLSLGVSLAAVWLYFGFPPFGQGAVPMTEGTLLNTLAKIVAIPLTLAIIGVGGLAAASALSCETDDTATREVERRKLALTTPAGIIWVIFVAAMAFPLGPVGNAIVVGASVLAVIRILQNAMALGIFQADGPSRDCPGSA